MPPLDRSAASVNRGGASVGILFAIDRKIGPVSRLQSAEPIAVRHPGGIHAREHVEPERRHSPHQSFMIKAEDQRFADAIAHFT